VGWGRREGRREERRREGEGRPPNVRNALTPMPTCHNSENSFAYKQVTIVNDESTVIWSN